jgi:hypothetical protein
MEKEILKIKELRRMGISDRELWSFILSSPERIQAWIHSQEEGKAGRLMWNYLLSQDQRAFLLYHLKQYPENPRLQWWELFQTYPWKARITAIKYLGELGEVAIPSLLKIIQTDSETRSQALLKLNAFHLTSLDIFQPLLQMLKNEDPQVRWNVLWNLKRFSPFKDFPHKKELERSLQPLLRDLLPSNQQMARSLLKEISSGL